MNLKPSDSVVREAVNRCVATIDVPSFDLAAIRARRGSAAAAPQKRRGFSRRALIAAPIAIVLAAVLINMPSVIAQVERALHAFAVVDGHVVPLQVRTVSLEEARAQMPFEVIPPAGVPAGLRLTINALSSASSPNDSRLIFQYRANDELPILTIEESSATAKGPTKLMISETKNAGPHAPVVRPPQDGSPLVSPAAPGFSGTVMRNVEVKRVHGRTATRSVTIHPIVWVERGTRIVIAAPDGSLTPRQINAIRVGMSQ